MTQEHCELCKVWMEMYDTKSKWCDELLGKILELKKEIELLKQKRIDLEG